MAKKYSNFFLFLFILFSFIGDSSAQYQSRGKELNYADADNFYKTGNYYDALPLFDLLSLEYPKVDEYKFKAGVCHLNLTDNPEKVIELFESLTTKKMKLNNAEFYLAKAYALNYQFNDAISTFEKALSNKKTTEDSKLEIPRLIEQCKNGIELIKDSLNVEIINIGEPINSADNEYSPTINADETILIFTYKGIKSKGNRQDEFNREEENGNFYEDIYITKLQEHVWSEPQSISDSINSNIHEASISLSPDGQKLYIYKDTKEASGDIFVSKKENGEWSEPEGLNINSADWEGHVAISPNGKFMIFSSDRPGGFGGKDLYGAYLQEDETWGSVKNLGAVINTKDNEDAPFIHSDGVTFNFSSEGHTSMGGYDIFESKIVKDSNYLQPRNIGYPINTTSNDIFFYVSGKGNAYYSSARNGGFGQQDIYVINVNDVITSKPVLLVKGVVKANDDFVVSKITVKTESGKDLGTYYSDVSDGKYQFYVDLNDYYVITYELEGFPSQVEPIDATKFTSYQEIEKDVNFQERDLSINGVALLRENPYSPLFNLKINLSNKDKSVNLTDTTDAQGKYDFSNLPNDEYYLLFLNEEDEKIIEDSNYLFKGQITMKGLPYSKTLINGAPTDDEGNYRIEMKNKFFGLLKGVPSSLDDMTEEDILKRYGDQTIAGLVFKVQVGAYTNPSNYNDKHLNGLGKIAKTLLDDGITRFTLGSLSTLRAAKKLEEQAKAKGQDDAFVIMFINGKRTYLEELINSNIFK